MRSFARPERSRMGFAQDDKIAKLTHFNWLSIRGCLTGAFIHAPWQGIQYHPSEQQISDFETKVGKKLAIVMTFLAWGSPDRLAPFPESWCSMVTRHGSLPMITWEPWDQQIECPHYRLDKILSGKWDSYLGQWADAIRPWGEPVLIRFAHEMNGTWYPWDGVHNASDSALYIKSFRYVVDFFKEQKCSNASWVWCPEVVLHLPHQGGAHDYTLYYPGDNHVDWIGFDGYNLGTVPTKGMQQAIPKRSDPWRSFDEIFGEAYRRMAQIAPEKPMMVCEVACGEGSGSKPEWIRETFKSIQNYPNFKALVWFNILKEAEWTVDSSSESLKAFQEEVRDPYFHERLC